MWPISTRNRVPVGRIAHHPLFANRGMPLPGSSSPEHLVEVTDRSSAEEVLSFAGLVLGDCWGSWLISCRTVAPEFNNYRWQIV